MKSRYKIDEGNYAHFITCSIVKWLPIFTVKRYCNIIIDSIKYCRRNKGLKIYGYVIMINHIHLIVSAPGIRKVIKEFKMFTARSIVDQLKQDNVKWLLDELAFFKKKYKVKSDFQVWQEGYHPKAIYSDDTFRQKLTYIHDNPVKKGLVSKSEDWVYSSARVYNGQEGVLKVDSFFG